MARCVMTKAMQDGATRAWSKAGVEPALSEVLADPVVHLVMRRDGVSPCELRRVIVAAQGKLRSCLCRRLAA